MLLVVLVWGWATPVLGEQSGAGASLPPEQEAAFQALMAEAMGHYQGHRYAQAVELFERAYEMRAEPELVYNIARSYERSQQLEDAISAYERFLALPATTSELRARARANLAAIRQEQAALEAAERQEGTPPTTPEQPPGGGPTDEPQSLGPLGIAGWVLFGVGAVTAVAGVVFAGLTITAESDFQAAEITEERLTLREDVERNALVADVLLISGGTVCLTGIILLIVNAVRGRDGAAEDDSGLAIFPSAAPLGSYGLGLRGRF